MLVRLDLEGFFFADLHVHDLVVSVIHGLFQRVFQRFWAFYNIYILVIILLELAELDAKLFLIGVGLEHQHMSVVSEQQGVVSLEQRLVVGVD